MMLELLSSAHAGIGRSQRALRIARRLPLRWIKRAWLSRVVLRSERARPDDITILIGVRNRADHRLTNALRSIRAQTHPADLIRTTVIDYGSDAASAALTSEICARYAAEYVRIDDAPVWSRSRCLNVGLRRAATKFVLTSDVDIVLSPRYVADAIEELKAAPLSVVCAPMLDLPPESVAEFRRMAEADEPLDVDAWRGRCPPRFDWPFHPSVTVTYAAFLKAIRGYDEYYELWGSDDADLMGRLTMLGLQARCLRAASFYLHQWHPKFEDVPLGKHAPQIRDNRAHLDRTHAILRNDRSWGLG